LKGRRIVGVRYRNAPGSGWPDGNASDAVHEVDMDVVIALDNESAAVISWAMNGLVEGLDLQIQRNSATDVRDDETDVAANPHWRPVVGRTVDEVASAWHVPNEGCPETLWAVRLSLSGGSSVVIGLGEVEDGIVQYQPDALVVLFDEAVARAYQPPASRESAFGTLITP
jgi:hypothetical protein